jgi:protein TonB
MTSGKQVRERGQDSSEPGATVPVRAERRWSPSLDVALSQGAVDLGNVVPFRRTREAARSAAPEIVVPAAGPSDAANLKRERVRLAAFAALSLLMHGALFAAFWRDPDPLASIGLPVMSVEIVVGATAPAGVATAPGENEVQAAASPTDPQPTEPAREAERKATEQPQDVPVAARDAAPEETTRLERQPDEPQPNDSESAARPQSDPKPAIAMVESPRPDQATAQPRQTPPDTMDVTLQPEPKQVKPAEAKPVQPKPEPKQRVAAKPAETKAAAPARVAAPTRDRASAAAPASTPSSPANNVGVGRSDYDTNYRGLVSAHLARYKQYPADARSSGKTGTAAVTFSIGGGGGVTSVSLARGSGVASIDQEVVAMVRRASPFPAPPGGRPQSFTVPVSFRLN